MARRKSLVGTIAQMQREAERARAAQIRAQAAAQREVLRTQTAYQRAAAAAAKDRQRLYAEARAAEVAALNADVDATLDALSDLLATTLDVDDHLDFDHLKIDADIPPFEPGELAVALSPPDPARYMPPHPTGLSKLLGKQKHEQAVAEARTRYDQDYAAFVRHEQHRRVALQKERVRHEEAARAARDEADRHNAEVDAFRQEFEAGEPNAVVSYFDLVLQASSYPDGFPQSFRLAYVPESRQLVVEHELPPVTVVPAVKSYKYTKSTDAINETARPASAVKTIYASVLAQVTLRTIHELFEADRGRHVDTIVFNGVVDTIDVATGQRVRPCLVSVRTTRDVFSTLDLAHVDPHACLRHLGAGVSKSPAELAPVRPVLEFDMVDPRFVEESDVLSGLDQRPNLMELSPKEFESLIQNLFTTMGLDARQTRPSRDGGVDCVAFDPRPIFGGKVVIQAKRYKHTVGVSAVRDLYGTLQNEGASKGILVTTSGYGQASFDFAAGKPIELIDGSNLLYLLAEHAGVEAKIVPPDGWRDPVLDVASEHA